MAKRTNGGTAKQTAGEAKAKRAPTRRSLGTKTDSATSSAADRAAGRRAGSIDQGAGQAPSNEDVARLAYEIYLERGGANGSHLEDWFEAERRLRGSK